MKNFYKKTRKEFKRILKKNKNITYHNWNDYAYKNGFFSSITIMAHEDVEKWEDLKKDLCCGIGKYFHCFYYKHTI